MITIHVKLSMLHRREIPMRWRFSFAHKNWKYSRCQQRKPIMELSLHLITKFNGSNNRMKNWTLLQAMRLKMKFQLKLNSKNTIAANSVYAFAQCRQSIQQTLHCHSAQAPRLWNLQIFVIFLKFYKWKFNFHLIKCGCSKTWHQENRSEET